MNTPLIILTGPTAVGKTALSIRLAQRIGGEIISADSVQVYRKMDIGSAKITQKEMCGIPHHLIDVLEPEDSFDVVQFQTMAKAAIHQISDRGRIPIIVGGTGFYIQSVLYDIDFTENEKDPTLRQSLEAETDPLVLHDMLKQVDPEAAEMIHPNNLKRTRRALEFYYQTGGQISVHNAEERQKHSPYQFAYFVLNDDRQTVYDRIDCRVDEMLKAGLVEEVRDLQMRGLSPEAVSMQGIGYRQTMQYLNGLIPYEEAVRLIKRDTRHFAKRQITWFKREKDVIWLDRRAFLSDDLILEEMLRILKDRGILPSI